MHTVVVDRFVYYIWYVVDTFAYYLWYVVYTFVYYVQYMVDTIESVKTHEAQWPTINRPKIFFQDFFPMVKRKLLEGSHIFQSGFRVYPRSPILRWAGVVFHAWPASRRPHDSSRGS